MCVHEFTNKKDKKHPYTHTYIHQIKLFITEKNLADKGNRQCSLYNGMLHTFVYVHVPPHTHWCVCASVRLYNKCSMCARGCLCVVDTECLPGHCPASPSELLQLLCIDQARNTSRMLAEIRTRAAGVPT